jgi:putative heme iron utilization protein
MCTQTNITIQVLFHTNGISMDQQAEIIQFVSQWNDTIDVHVPIFCVMKMYVPSSTMVMLDGSRSQNVWNTQRSIGTCMIVQRDTHIQTSNETIHRP